MQYYRSFWLNLILILFCFSFAHAQPKQQLSVLYVSGTKDYMGNPLENTANREADFRSFLDRYFSQVRTIRDIEFTPERADDADVIVVDGNIMGRVPASFRRPMVLIGNGFAPSMLASELGSKLSPLCRCLRDKLHSIRSDHPIFKSPLPVVPTLIDDKDPVTGRQIHVWKVHEPLWGEGTFKWTYEIGSVASGQLLLEAEDSEIISGGVNVFGDYAVALAREANFFLWGPAAVPSEMTEEGKRVFVNTIAYMKRFDGARQTVRRGTPTREVLLSRFSETGMNSFAKNDPNVKARSIHRLFPSSLVERLGYDMEKYRQMYQPNAGYVYVPHGTETYAIDDEARSIGIPNNDVQFLDKCIGLLDQRTEAAKAKRLLERYTGLSFPTVQAWRQWLDTNRDRLYFSDYYDYRFYTGPAAPAPPRSEVQKAIWEMKMDQVKGGSFGAAAVGYIPAGGKGGGSEPGVYTTEKGALVTLVLQLKPFYGQWVYGRAPNGASAETAKIDVELPPGSQWVGDWQLPESRTDAETGAIEYGGDSIVFKRNFYVTAVPKSESGVLGSTTLILKGNFRFQLFRPSRSSAVKSSDPVGVPFETRISVINR